MKTVPSLPDQAGEPSELQSIHDTLHKVRAMVSDQDEAWIDIGVAMARVRAMLAASPTAPTTGSAPEPVAWRYRVANTMRFHTQQLDHYYFLDGAYVKGEPLYAAPPANAPVASVPFRTFDDWHNDPTRKVYVNNKESARGVWNACLKVNHPASALTDSARQTIQTSANLLQAVGFGTKAEELRALLAASMGGDRT